MINGALDLASHIAKMSPVAVSGTKHNLNYSRDHSVDESLEYMVSAHSVAVLYSIILLIVILNQSWRKSDEKCSMVIVFDDLHSS